MAPFFGLTGRSLHAAIWTESLAAVMIFGYNSAGAGGVLDMPSFEKQFPTIDVANAPPSEAHQRSTIQGLLQGFLMLETPSLTSTRAGTIVALYTLLGVFGALACTFGGDFLGRRRTIFVAAVLNLIGVIIMGTSYSLGQFIVGRIFIGLGTGAIVATVPIWQSEVSRAESRGGHVSSMGIYCGSGLSMALWIAFGMGFTSGEATWRFPISGSGILSIIVMSTIFMMPESPRWYFEALV